MNVNVLGYKFEQSLLPPAMRTTEVYTAMAEKVGVRVGKAFRCGAVRMSIPTASGSKEWIAGMVLRIRDARGFIKLTEVGGTSKLTSQDLGEGENLAELSFFLAEPTTGSGLLTHHHHATSLNAFGAICGRVFNRERREKRKVAIQEVIEEQREALEKQYAGDLKISQLCLSTDLKTLVAQLKRVNSFDFTFSTVVTKETMFRGIAERAVSEKIQFRFPPDADVGELAEQVEAASKNESVSKLRVHGKDSAGKPKSFGLDRNPLVFAAYDYDSMMSGLELDLADWPASIQNAPAIAKLAGVAATAEVNQLLTKA